MSQLHSRRLVGALSSAFLVIVFSASGWLGAQGAKRPLSYDAYDYWHAIGGTRLSDDGQWLAYALTAQGEDGVLVVRNLKSGQEIKSPRGICPEFTHDARFVIFNIVPTKAEQEPEAGAAAAGAATPAAPQGGGGGGATACGGGAGRGNARNALGIMTLSNGQVQTVERVATFSLPEESSTWLAYHRGNPNAGRGGRGGGRGGGRVGAAGGGRAGAGAPAGAAPAAQPPTATPAGQAVAAEGAPAENPGEKRKDAGTDLVVRNLATGQETTIAEVSDYTWNKDGSWIAYAVSSADAAKDGAFARRMSDTSLSTLRKGRGNYRSLTFNQAGNQIAFLSDQAEYDKPVSPYRLYYWKAGDLEATELVSAATRGMPAGRVVSENFAPRFSDDGLRLFLGFAPAPAQPAGPNAKAPTRVDLWSSKDPLIQPMQQVRANQDRNRNYSAVVQLSDKRLVILGSEDLPTVTPGDDAVRAVGTSGVPYQQEMSWDSSYSDVYLVDLKTGNRRKVLEHHGGTRSLSPGGGYLLYFDEPSGDWFTYRIADGTRTNLTDRLPVKFFDESHDTPDLPPSLGSAGWTEGDRSVLLNDAYDIWEIRPDGSNARMVTGGEGRKQHLIFRYRSLDTDQRAVSMTKPMLLSTTDENTRAAGYYRLAAPATGGVPEKLMMVDKAVGPPTKAKHADVVVFTEQTFAEFPDLWVSDTSFKSPQKASNANPQQAEYVWGKAERIKYRNADGKELGAILIKPENFDPSKKYPLMVYIYEDLSEGLHSYKTPNVGTSINLTRYVSNGYVVLEPDISYETGYPGPSAMKCVIPAINTIVAQGYIDPARIGIQGHSWGGYQITYMITQTNIFRAVEAGASVSNMISAYGGIRWGTGMVREFQYEKTQSRIGAPPWDAPLQFIENSPIFWIERIHTPYLTIHNDADDAVPWYQGIEFNTAMRRLGKEAYMFSFNGEPHGLRNRDNMKYWTVHMDEFFDHYLLGKPRPEWMDKGVPFLQKGTRDVSPLFKRATPAPAGQDR